MKTNLLLILGAALVAACSHASNDVSAGTGAGADGGGSNGGSAGGGAMPSPQSPVPPDGPCTTTPGQVVQLYSGSVSAFAVDDAYVYVSSMSGVVRVPVAGGAPAAVAGADAGLNPLGGLALGGGAILFAAPGLTLGRIPVPDDPTTSSYGASFGVGGGLAYDGLAIYTSHIVMAGQTALARIPLDGSASTSTDLPMGTMANVMAPGLDGIYLGISHPVNVGSIVKIAPGKDPVTLVSNLSQPNAIAVDDSYVYFSDTNGSFTSGGIGRVAFDGSGLVTLTTPNVWSLAVDAHALYFLRGGVMKMDKSGGTPMKIAADPSPGGSLVVVHGGNVFWAADSGGSSGGSVTGGVWTTCK